MAYIITAIFLWSLLLVQVHLKGFKKYYPTLIFSAMLGTLSDILGIFLNQWSYNGPTVGGLSFWSVLGIAPAEGGLFIRLFPKSKNQLIKIGYWIIWALLNTVAERFFVWAGWIGYYQWNCVRAFLFYLFFFGAVWLQEYWYNGTGRLR